MRSALAEAGAPIYWIMGSFKLQPSARIAAMNSDSFVAPVFQPARHAEWKVGVTRTWFRESLHDCSIAHWDREPSGARVGARASWTAATESSESPLWGRSVDGALRDLERCPSESGDLADSVTALQNLAADLTVPWVEHNIMSSPDIVA